MAVPTSFVNFFVRHRKLGGLALRCIPDIERRIEIDHIGPFKIRLRRNRSYWLRHPLAMETRMLGFLKRLVRPGVVFYDIGANLGMHSRFAARFGAGQVFAFEPMSENIVLLRQNVALAGENAGKIRIMQMSAGDQDGEEALQVDDVMSGTAVLDKVNPGEASLGRKLYGFPPVTERVRVARLDTLIASGALPPADVIKIDVEGAEDLVLEGAPKLLAEQKPDLAIELHSQEKARKVLSLLDKNGYVSFAYVLEDGVMKYRRVRAGEETVLTQNDHIIASADITRLEAAVEPFR